MVVAVGVDGEFAKELAGGCVDDADVEVLDEQDDVGSGVDMPDPHRAVRDVLRHQSGMS